MSPELQPIIPKYSPKQFLSLLLFSIVLVNFIVALTTVFILRNNYLQIEKQTEIRTTNLSLVLDHYLDGVISKMSLIVLSVKNEFELNRESIKGKSPQFNYLINHGIRQVTEIDRLGIADSNGNVVYAVGQLAKPYVNIKDRDYFIQTGNNPNLDYFIAKPYKSRTSGNWVFNISRRLNNPDGSFAGVVYAEMKLQRLTDEFSKIHIGPKGVIGLRDLESGLVARYPELEEQGSAIGQKNPSNEMKALVLAGAHHGTYFTPGGPDNIPRIVSFRKLARYPFYVFVGIASEHYLAQWWRELYILSGANLVFLLGTVLSAWLFYRDWAYKMQVNLLLAEQERKFRTVADHTYDWEFWISPEGKFIYCSPSCKRVTGFDASDFYNNPGLLRNIILDEDLHAFAGHKHEIADYPIPNGVDFRIVHADGTIRWLNHICQPVIGDSDSFFGIRGSNKDITERKIQQEILANQKAELVATLERTKHLEGILSICMHCKKIRTTNESWDQLEKYISEHSDALFSHSICPDCFEKHYPAPDRKQVE